jgi:hypothetical protein
MTATINRDRAFEFAPKITPEITRRHDVSTGCRQDVGVIVRLGSDRSYSRVLKGNVTDLTLDEAVSRRSCGLTFADDGGLLPPSVDAATKKK